MNILLVAYICWHVTLNLHFRFAVSSIIWNRYWLFDLIKCELNETRPQRDYSGYFVLNILLDECLRFFFPRFSAMLLTFLKLARSTTLYYQRLLPFFASSSTWILVQTHVRALKPIHLHGNFLFTCYMLG